MAKTTTLKNNKKAAPAKPTKAEKPKGPETVCRLEEFPPGSNKAMFVIHDKAKLDAGENYSQIVAFGYAKARALGKHLDELKEFIALAQAGTKYSDIK